MTAPGVTRTAVQIPVEGVAVDHVDAVWHHPEGPADGAFVLVTHGAGGTIEDPAIVAFADVVAAAGHPSVRCTMPYRQRRTAGPPPRAERGVGDLAAVIAGLLRVAPEPRPWVLAGKSYGGRLATMVAADMPEVHRVVDLAGRLDLAGVACLSYPLHPPGRPDRLRVAHLAAVRVPLLFVQGTNDPFGGPEELVPHVADLVAPVTVVPVPGGDHALKVPRTRSADGATHAPAEVVAGLADACTRWLADLGVGG